MLKKHIYTHEKCSQRRKFVISDVRYQFKNHDLISRSNTSHTLNSSLIQCIHVLLHKFKNHVKI